MKKSKVIDQFFSEEVSESNKFAISAVESFSKANDLLARTYRAMGKLEISFRISTSSSFSQKLDTFNSYASTNKNISGVE
mgnify:CR=1 FL=1